MLGYEKKESLFLKKDNIRGIFNLTGIVFAPILYKGDVIGRWKLNKKQLECLLFEEVDICVVKDIESFILKTMKEVNEVLFEHSQL